MARSQVRSSARTILGPILVLFVSHMPEFLNSFLNLVMFADDSKCFTVIKSLCDSNACQNDQNALYAWSISNELHFQPPKCYNLRVNGKKTSLDHAYILNGANIESVNKERDLGVAITKELTWNKNISLIVSKANKNLGFIKRNC